MRKSIKTNRALHATLRKRFGVTSQMVYYSLNYIQNGKKAAEIRRVALDLGGVYVEEDFIPTCTIEDIPGGIRQIFADEVVLEMNFKKSVAEIRHHGESVLKVDHVTLDGWGSLAMQAQQLGLEGRFEIPV